MSTVYNTRCPAVKRLLNEAKELRNPTEEYYAQPLDEDLFEWHFTVRGPPDTEYENGIYHGRITLPPDYPLKPPNIIFSTPNGRFQTNSKLCLSISGHHPETWQPSWSIRTAILAIIGFMPTPARGTLGGLDYSPDERKKLAKRSEKYVCSQCGCVKDLLIERSVGSSNNIQKEASEISARMAIKPPLEDISTVRKRDIERSNSEESLQESEGISNREVSYDNINYESVAVYSSRHYLTNVLVIIFGLLLIFLCIRRLFLTEDRIIKGN